MAASIKEYLKNLIDIFRKLSYHRGWCKDIIVNCKDNDKDAK